MNLTLPRVVANLRAMATAGSHLQTQVIWEKKGASWRYRSYGRKKVPAGDKSNLEDMRSSLFHYCTLCGNVVDLIAVYALRYHSDQFQYQLIYPSVCCSSNALTNTLC